MTNRLLVPVSDSGTLRQTVAHAVETAVEAEPVDESAATIHFVVALSRAQPVDADEPPGELLDRVAVWAAEDRGDADLSIETALIGSAEYLFSPDDYADVLAEYAADAGLDHAIFDPGYNPFGTAPLLPPLERELERRAIVAETAPVQRDRRFPSLVERGTVFQALALGAVAFGFYLLLAGSVAPFELVTGAITASVVATALWGVSLTAPVRPGRDVVRVARLLVYVPYLLAQIAVANLQIAYVVLHPDLPIDPEMVEFDAAVWSPLAATTLANSITLTPGTLTVDVSRRTFTVHTLTTTARDDLFDGGLERAVRFVFYGRSAARGAGPAEREEVQE
ncbi:monovalent cation/H+ antiporter subunit E [Halococcoides cellulosivorans]|uniref:Cation:proton antiporter n=1 Tax=Halococcoides cellulosivorans TaxID=1679096 RepID=A0A2R4WYY8_9EURY|nr:monovalent cation/H+ antiporter subunit E [Halococcoides cellulosivorans]AWB26753.1 cation:proton antiporter [Halococcoides cellulosivorans]